MAVQVEGGVRKWGPARRDKDGHREFQAFFLVVSDDGLDTPAAVFVAAGLPAPGSAFAFPGTTGPDALAYATLERTVEPHDAKEGERVRYWLVGQTYTTRPQNTCKDEQVEDPLRQPQKISGSWTNKSREMTRDRFGTPIRNSAFETIKGPQIEFDDGTGQVVIEQNVEHLSLPVLAALQNHVNDAEMWGFPPRCVKFSEFTWERKVYGQCYVYYTRRLTFDVCVENVDVEVDYDGSGTVPPVLESEMSSGFDRDLQDEGTKCLRGKWDTDPTSPQFRRYVIPPGVNPSNPADFVRFKDFNGENARTLLDGFGKPVDADVEGTAGTAGDEVGVIRVEYYAEADLFALGVPEEL